MIEFATLGRLGLLLARPGMLVVTAPVFGGIYAPGMVKIGLTVLLTFLLFPIVHVPDAGTTVAVVMVVMREMAIGLAMSLSIRALLSGAEFAGSITSVQIGFSMGSVIDPASGVRNNLLSVLYGNITLLTFFAINGHHALVRTLVDSYTTLPIGMGGVDASIVRSVTSMLGMIFMLGVRLAMPIIVVMLVVELSMGLVARAAPMLNLMSVGMPVRLIVGLLVVTAVIQIAPSVIGSFTTTAMQIAAAATHGFR